MRKFTSVILIAVFFVCAWYVWSVHTTDKAAQRHAEALVERWEKAPGTCAHLKEIDALLRIPALDLTKPIVDGVTDDVLDSGVVGAYPGEPGKGNYSLAGHRVTHGSPFADLPNLGIGDKVFVDYNCKTYVYRVNSIQTVDHIDTSVLLETKRTEITLITCSELWHTDNRTVVKGVLVSRS